MYLLIAAILAASSPTEEYVRLTRDGRTERGYGRTGSKALAFFEFAPASGAGMGAACACTTPTGARGEAMTFTRASTTTCTKTLGGFPTATGIANGDVVVCTANQPAVEMSSTGQLGLAGAQGSFAEVLLRTEEISNATWSDVATPTITADSATSPDGALTADTLDDNNAAAFEGRSQTVTVTAAAAYTMSCYVKAGTLAKVRLSLDGTTGDTASLSSTSWTRVSVTDASTSGVSVSAQVLGGNAVGDTGTIYVWGCNVTAGTTLRPYIPATSATVTTAAEVPYFTLTNAPALYSYEVTVDTPAAFIINDHFATFYKDGTNRVEIYRSTGSGLLGCFNYVGGVAYEGFSSVVVPTSTSGVRVSCSYDGTNVIACVNGSCNSTAKSFAMPSGMTSVYLGAYSLTGFEANPSPVIRGIKADPSPSRFR